MNIEPNTSDFRLVDRKVADIVISLREQQRFFRGMVSWVGFKQKAIPFDAAPRHSGSTKYTLSKMIHLAVTGVLSYSYLPLYIVIMLSFVFIIAGLGYSGYIIYLKFFTEISIPGHSAILMLNLIVAGLQCFGLAVLSMYILKTFHEVKNRPIYIVDNLIGFEEKEPEISALPARQRRLPTVEFNLR